VRDPQVRRAGSGVDLPRRAPQPVGGPDAGGDRVGAGGPWPGTSPPSPSDQSTASADPEDARRASGMGN
jgi:hypothetical protein